MSVMKSPKHVKTMGRGAHLARIRQRKGKDSLY